MPKYYNPDLAELKARGFSGETYTRVLRPGQLAADAALVTSPNMGVPGELLTFFDPEVVDILTAPLRAREITGGKVAIKGDATTATALFPGMEMTGHTEPYHDFANGGTAGTNYNWVPRDNYLFSTTRQMGDLEEQRSAEAKIRLSADEQKAAAHIIDTDMNRFFFLGVAGLRNYGLLNDPSLLANLTPDATGTGNSPLWANKTTEQIYADILKLFSGLVTNTRGVVTKDAELVLAMSPGLAVRLATANSYGISVMTLLGNYFAKLRVVSAPEYATGSGELMQMIAVNVQGKDTILLANSENFYAFAPVRDVSSIRQKYRAGTYGAIIRRPVAMLGMLGM